MKIPDDVTQRLLGHWPVARLASTGPDGRPHQVPIVFAYVNESLWTPVDGKPKGPRELTRVANLRARPEASVLLDDYSDEWSSLWWIRIDTIATVIQPADPQAEARVEAAVRALREKYPQYADVPLLPDPPTLIMLRPTAIRSWCADLAALTKAGL